MSHQQQDFNLPTVEEMAAFMRGSSPPVVADQAAPATRSEVATIDLKKLALSRFGDWRKEASVVIAKYAGVIFDAQTPKGYKALEQAISEVRSGRYMGQRVSKASKTELADVSRAVGAEETAIAEFLGPTEQELLRQKKVEDDRRAAVAEAARIADTERIAQHLAGIAKIRAMPAAARGKPSDRISAGIDYVRGLSFGPEWEEFKDRAAIACVDVLAELESMHSSAKNAEAAEAAAVAQRAEQARVAEAQRIEAARLRAESEALAAQQREAAAVLAKQQEDFAAEVAAFKAKQEAAEQATRDAIARQKKRDDDEWVRRAEAEAAQHVPKPPIDLDLDPAAKAWLGELTEDDLSAEAAPESVTATPFDASVTGVSFSDRQANPVAAMDAATLALLREALEFTKYAAAPFVAQEHKRTPKTTAEWWAGLGEQIDRLQPLLIAAIGQS